MILDAVRFGPAGYPAEAKGKIEGVFSILKELGLYVLEYAAVRGLRMSEARAQQIREHSERAGVMMTMHGAYYISLASKNPETREKSKLRLINGLHWAPKMGVRRIVFHPGGYGGLSKEDAFKVVRDALQEVWTNSDRSPREVMLAPEIAGKLSMFGSQEEIIGLCQQVEGCIPTIDWAHLYARTQGAINDRDSFLEVLNKFEEALGNLFTKNMHFHISGITYTEAGEKAHRPLGEEWGPDILPLLEIVQEVGYKPTFISETPEPVKGALYAKFLFEGLENREE
ncbi:MAG: TIM barrel protein [Candidatus Thorarchaeota archaeon]